MSIDKSKLEKPKGAEISRREFLKTLIGGAAGALCFDLKKAIAQESEMPSRWRYKENGWFFTPEKTSEIYEQEYNGDKILKNQVFKKNDEWYGLYEGKEFKIPKEFFNATLAHFKDMLKQKAVQYFFRLDAFHGHLFVPENQYSRYTTLQAFDQASILVEDKNLGILYHNSEHLKHDTDSESAYIASRRNVLGWYDNRPIEILPLPTEKKSTAVATPGHDLSPWLKFAANKNGEFFIMFNGEEVRLDFSFDDNSYY